MNKRAQVNTVVAFIMIFVFVIVATALLPVLGNLVTEAETGLIGVDNENQTVTNESYNAVTLSNVPVRTISQVTNATGQVVVEQDAAPGWQLVDGTIGNVSVNYSGVDFGSNEQDVQIDYTYFGSSNLSTTDDTLLSLWPTFIVIGGLLAVLGAAGLLR
jgi:hypothetical protein